MATASDTDILAVLRSLHPLVKRLFIGVAASALGNGLTMPFLFVYLTGPRGLSKTMVGLVISFMGMLGFVLAPIGGSLIDRFGPRPVMLVGLAVEMAGVLALSQITTIGQAFAVGALVVAGTVGLWPAATAMMTRLVAQEHRETVYGFQFMLLNAGLGVGGLISSLLIPTQSVPEFQRLYLLNAACYLVYIVVLLTLPSSTGRFLAEQPGVDSGPQPGWGVVLRDRTLLKVVGTSILVLIFGYAQFEVGFPAYATDVAKVPADRLGWAYAANTGAIVALQVVALGFLRGRRRTRMLALCAGIWCVAWVVIAASGWFPGTTAIVLVVLGLGIFGVGETFWAPVAPAIVNDLAEESVRGRYNALQGMTWTVSTILGPALAGFLMGHELPQVWAALTVGGTAVGALLMLRLGRSLTPAQNGVAERT